MLMIEVEIRGKLTEEEFLDLKERIAEKGSFVEHHEREMILLYDYPGYDIDPIARNTDIRLRKTNGQVEIMLKRKASDHNVGREEVSLPLGNDSILGSWEKGKQILKGLGFGNGLWMARTKDIYRIGDTEWSLVEAPDKHFYYEAEREVEPGSDLAAIHAELEKEAQELGLSVLAPEEMREFIYMLDKAVNKEIEW